jgi:fumarate hydratase class II
MQSKKSNAMRVEKDSLGTMEIPSNKYWGSQTQRSTINFHIGEERVSLDLIYAVAAVK